MDSKDPLDQLVLQSKECPLLVDYLNTRSQEHFVRVCDLLARLNVRFVLWEGEVHSFVSLPDRISNK